LPADLIPMIFWTVLVLDFGIWASFIEYIRPLENRLSSFVLRPPPPSDRISPARNPARNRAAAAYEDDLRRGRRFILGMERVTD
jgi:hypothetical protein